MEKLTFLEKAQNLEFKNDAVKEMVLSIVPNVKEFESRRKAFQFRGILLGIADTFTEDKAVIYSLFEQSNPAKNIPSGGANFFPGGKKKTNKSVLVRSSGGDCIGGDCVEMLHTDESQSKTTTSSTDKVKELKEVAQRDKESKAFGSIDSVLDRFEDNSNAMKAFAQNRGITIPANVSKPETIAKYIVAHYAKTEEE